MIIYQCLWVILGLFFGLLLVSPHHIISTRTCTAKFICVLVVVGSLIGMMGMFKGAWFLIACAVVVLIKQWIVSFMVEVNRHKTDPSKHKSMERNS